MRFNEAINSSSKLLLFEVDRQTKKKSEWKKRKIRHEQF